MPTELSPKLQTWPIDKSAFQNAFKALMEEEDGIVQQRGLQDFCHAFVIFEESGEFDGWIESGATESLRARFELLATKAGIALGSPLGMFAQTFWLQSLFLDLRANRSSYIQVYSPPIGIIERLFEASAIFCARLDRRSLENAAMYSEDCVFEGKAVDQGTEVTEGVATESSHEESIQERSERRCAVVMPILASKRWTRGKWAARGGVGKNGVYEYLAGKRNLHLESRQALADELALKLEEFPD